MCALVARPNLRAPKWRGCVLSVRPTKRRRSHHRDVSVHKNIKPVAVDSVSALRRFHPWHFHHKVIIKQPLNGHKMGLSMSISNNKCWAWELERTHCPPRAVITAANNSTDKWRVRFHSVENSKSLWDAKCWIWTMLNGAMWIELRKSAGCVKRVPICTRSNNTRKSRLYHLNIWSNFVYRIIIQCAVCGHFYEIYFNKSSFFFALTQFPKIVANLALMRSLLDIENEGNLRGKLYNFNGLDSVISFWFMFNKKSRTKSKNCIPQNSKNFLHVEFYNSQKSAIIWSI